MTLSSTLNLLRSTARNHGTLPATYDFAVRSVNKCVYYKTMQCLVIDKVNRQYSDLPPHLRFTRLEAPELLGFAGADNELNADFLTAALAKGDECYAILDGNILASYGWYSQRPTLTDSEDLALHFDAKYIYMYKGFTVKPYRGQRLHAIGMSRALADYQARGFAGLVSYVESNNFDSLKSCHRMGYRDCGCIRIARLGGRYLIRTQPECRPYGLTIREVLAGKSAAN